MQTENSRQPEAPTIDIEANSNGRVSTMAHRLVGSEILRIAADIRALVSEGKRICNLTVGDFSPKEFRPPTFLEEGIKQALSRGETNYPPPDGILALREAIKDFYDQQLGLTYPLASVLVTGGSRPGIYSAYRALVDPGDVVVYPVPSWNNNHYCHLAGARQRPVVCDAGLAFLPTRGLLEDAVRGARLLVLNSPLNPTGTAFDQKSFEDICDLVLEENRRRGPAERPLYLLYDQVYWMLTFGNTRHVNPVSTRPALRDYTIYVDGISKAFAATGLRVGWAVGPTDVVQRMASIVAHVGAWAPRAEQVATAYALQDAEGIRAYHKVMKGGVEDRLNALYKGMMELRSQGFPVNVVEPMGAIYLSTQFKLHGKKGRNERLLQSNEDIREYLLTEAQVAVVPFQAFGCREDSGWFRLSVGAVSQKDIEEMFPLLRKALEILR